MKLLGSTKSKITTQDEYFGNVPRLEITEAVILSTTIINKIQEFYIHLFLTNRSVNYQIFHSKMLFFKKN